MSKLTIDARVDNTNVGAVFEVELPEPYGDMVNKGFNIAKVVRQGVNEIKKVIEEGEGNGRDTDSGKV